MADTTYDDLILSGLIDAAATTDRYRRARREVQPVFLLGTHRLLFEFALRYYAFTDAVLDPTGFSRMTADVDPVTKLTMEQEYARLWQLPVQEPHFRYALHAIREQRRNERFVVALTEAMRAFQTAEGYEGGRTALREGLTEIDRWFESDHVEGNVWDDAHAVIAKYEEAKNTGGLDVRAVQTGISVIDNTILALRPGENMLFAGYSGHGKTTLIQNVAWHASTQQSKNVVVFTNENSYEQYRDRLFNRHLHTAVAGGIPHADFRRGAMAGQTELAFRSCLGAVHGDAFGKLFVVQMPKYASMEWVGGQMDRFAEEFDVGLIVLDYIGRMAPITKRASKREEINDTIIAWTNALTDFDRGRGVPGITGYQISREKMNSALLSGYYTLDCLAETSEAERNASVVVTILKQDDVDNEARIQIPKNRDGATLEPTPVLASYPTTLITADSGGWLR